MRRPVAKDEPWQRLLRYALAVLALPPDEQVAAVSWGLWYALR
jgi:hypothetical protein